MRNIFKTQEMLFKTMVCVENHRRQKLTKVTESYNLITTEYTRSNILYKHQIPFIVNYNRIHKVHDLLIKPHLRVFTPRRNNINNHEQFHFCYQPMLWIVLRKCITIFCKRSHTSYYSS